MNLMCNFRIDKAAVSEQFDITFDDYFQSSLAQLGDLLEVGFVRDSEEQIEVRGSGRLFVRNAAMAFDRYLEAKAENKPAFSRTV